MHQPRLLALICLSSVLGGLISACTPPVASPTPTAPPPTDTPPPTPQPTPTSTPAPPSITELDHVDVPAWVSDPDASVVMFRAGHTGESGKSADTISMVDAVTGQHFDLPLNVPHTYFWMPDGRSFGYVDSEVHSVDSATGQVSQLARSALTRRFIDSDSSWPSMASGQDPASPDFFIFPAPNNYGRTEISEDLRFAAIYDDNDLVVENLQTGQQVVVPRSDPFIEVNSQWLPRGSTLAILRHEGEIDRAFGGGEWRLDFFDAADGQIVASYSDVSLSGWSPDGEMVMYTDDDIPCILKWRSGEHWCLDDAQDIHHAEDIYSFDWSPDGSMISLAYWKGSGKHGTGGICVKNLDHGDVVCPMLDHPTFADGVVQNYGWSADSKYLLFNFSIGSCPGCDFQESSNIGIISTDGRILHYPIGDLQVYPTDSAIWRPPIASR